VTTLLSPAAMLAATALLSPADILCATTLLYFNYHASYDCAACPKISCIFDTTGWLSSVQAVSYTSRTVWLFSPSCHSWHHNSSSWPAWPSTAVTHGMLNVLTNLQNPVWLKSQWLNLNQFPAVVQIPGHDDHIFCMFGCHG
jgi:hypothetical protein